VRRRLASTVVDRWIWHHSGPGDRGIEFEQPRHRRGPDPTVPLVGEAEDLRAAVLDAAPLTPGPALAPQAPRRHLGDLKCADSREHRIASRDQFGRKQQRDSRSLLTPSGADLGIAQRSNPEPPLARLDTILRFPAGIRRAIGLATIHKSSSRPVGAPADDRIRPKGRRADRGL
jgi:hypothetical protein